MHNFDRDLEVFVESTIRPVSKRLSTDEVVELRLELRSHLEEQIRAYRELGCSDDEAKTEAINTFGNRHVLDTMPRSSSRWIWLATYFTGSLLVQFLLAQLILLVTVVAGRWFTSSESMKLTWFQWNLFFLNPSSWMFFGLQALIIHRFTKMPWKAGLVLGCLDLVLRLHFEVSPQLALEQYRGGPGPGSWFFVSMLRSFVIAFVSGVLLKLAYNSIDTIRKNQPRIKAK